ncbi:MAG TPA: DsbA family protein, partial [SAR324 cluster bacterium]|nr:DsbA family protein [SAR324 cluster bacterium]
EKTGDPEIKQSLIQATDEAVSRGLFGAPTFLVGQEMFFGHDRMDLLEAFLQDRL